MTIVEVAVMMRGTMVLVAGYINIGAALCWALWSLVMFDPVDDPTQPK